MAATLETDLDAIVPPGDPDEFVVVSDRPVWSEHWTREGRNDEGEVETESVYMGEPELQQVAENCNERIRNTGDFAPLVINHTKEDGSVDPEVIGFAGPYYVSQFGKEGKATIFAKKFWIFKQDYEKYRKHPRVSVEYWSSKSDPTNGILDPISCLGATTPELDLGIRYGRTSDGIQILRYSRAADFVERYEASAAPGGSNTFIPDCDLGDKRKHKYEASEGGGMLSEEALNQIVDALSVVIDAKLEEKMASLKTPEPVVDADAVPTGAEDALGGDMPPGDMPPEMAGEAGLDEDVPPDLDADADLEAGPLDDEGDGLDDDDGDDVDVVDEDDDEQPVRYSADHPADAGSESLSESQHLLEGAMSAADDLKKSVQRYERAERERDDYKQKYQKEVAGHRDTQAKYAKLKEEVDGYKVKEMRATRYAKLAELHSQGFVFDIDEEIKDVMGEAESGQAMTDPQFDKHCDRIVNKYSRVPVGRALPQDKPEKIEHKPTRDDKRREQYAKQAIANVNAAKLRGERTTYEIELKKIYDADSDNAAA